MAGILLQVIIVLATCLVTVNTFQAGNCANPSYGTLPIELRRVRLSPSNIHIPSIMRLEIDFLVREEFGAPTTPLKARVHMTRIAYIGFGWLSFRTELPVPCIDVADGLRIGTCDYEDLCGMVEYFIGNNTNEASATCLKAEEFGFPCSCPVPAGTYSTGRRYIELDLTEGTDQIPSTASLLLSGEYETTVQLRTSLDNDDAKILGCFHLNYDISID